MNRRPPAEALQFAAATHDALARLGGVDMARRAELDPGARTRELEPVLGELGLLDLAPLRDGVETIAAALAVREAGAVVCPWPLAAAVGCDVEGADAAFPVAGPPGRMEHLDLLRAPVAVDGDGRLHDVRPVGDIDPAPLDPFGVRCAATLRSEQPASPPRLPLLLLSFWILGAVGSVARLATDYSRERRQFGRPIGEFGAVRWRLADMAVARTGLEELASYTLWLHVAGRLTDADVLALRLFALEAASEVLTHGHQVLAAIGLCDEHDLSVVSRHLQPALRRPGGIAATGERLARAVERDGFDALFPVASLDGDGRPAVAVAAHGER